MEESGQEQSGFRTTPEINLTFLADILTGYFCASCLLRIIVYSLQQKQYTTALNEKTRVFFEVNFFENLHASIYDI